MKKSPPSTQRKPGRAKGARYRSEDDRWAAVVEKDARAAGRFFYAVQTSGIYCEPSCPARPALRKNVRFFDTADDAEAAGYRACKRCWPKGPKLAELHAAAVEKACRHIEAADYIPPLHELARAAGMSAFHFNRIFKSITGLTPKAYALNNRGRRALQQMMTSRTVTDAIFGAGFQSSGRFYAEAPQRFGMTPSAFRDGGSGAEIRFAVGECSLGALLVAATTIGVCAIALDDDPAVLVRELQDRFPKAELTGDDDDFAQLLARVIGMVENPGTGADLPLDLQGSIFQERVWQALRKIPLGETITYTELAQRIGSSTAVRAVAGACAANPIAVAVPCHRVVRIGGDLSGYRWGVERKRALLEREARSRVEIKS